MQSVVPEMEIVYSWLK